MYMHQVVCVSSVCMCAHIQGLCTCCIHAVHTYVHPNEMDSFCIYVRMYYTVCTYIELHTYVRMYIPCTYSIHVSFVHIEFLEDQFSSCQISVADMASICNAASSINMELYTADYGVLRVRGAVQCRTKSLVHKAPFTY